MKSDSQGSSAANKVIPRAAQPPMKSDSQGSSAADEK